MLKRFWSYQRLLLNSYSQHFRRILLLMLFMFSIVGIFPGVEMLSYALAYALFMVYCIINSSKKIFEIVPVSKIYSVVNIYLLSFILSLTISIVASITFMTIEFLMPLSNNPFNIYSIIGDWKAILVIGALSFIILSFLLPIFFIRHNYLRKILVILGAIIVGITGHLFMNSLISANAMNLEVINDKSNYNQVLFLKLINAIPNCYEFFILLVSICIVIMPISFFLSCRLYKGKGGVKC